MEKNGSTVYENKEIMLELEIHNTDNSLTYVLVLQLKSSIYRKWLEVHSLFGQLYDFGILQLRI